MQNGEFMNWFFALELIICLPFIIVCAYGLITNDWVADARRKQEAEWNKKIQTLHDYRRDRFDIAGHWSMPYEEAVAILDCLDRGEFPIRFCEDGQFSGTKIVMLDEIKDFMRTNQEDGTRYWTHHLDQRRWAFSQNVSRHYFDDKAIDHFCNGEIEIRYQTQGDLPFETSKVMTFAEARKFMDETIKEVMKKWFHS